MRKYGGLLSQIAEEYLIPKGNAEPEDAWKTRVIYSILGRMAYASLWDTREDGEPVSITHMKNRVARILNTYRKAYPEISTLFPRDPDEIADEIYGLFLRSGVIYHRPERITASAYSAASVEGLLFVRGGAIEHAYQVCGLGTCSSRKNETATTTIQTMFQIPEQTLTEEWNDCVRNARWSPIQSDYQTEYLRTAPPFTKGYWTEKPETDGIVSILRKGSQGSRLYFLYRTESGKMAGSQLPAWKVDGYRYRALSNARLDSLGSLPPIRFLSDGEIVSVSFDYLLPPEEQAFFNLYSWPTSCNSFPCDFKRICTKQVFQALRTVLEQRGFHFKEV